MSEVTNRSSHQHPLVKRLDSGVDVLTVTRQGEFFFLNLALMQEVERILTRLIEDPTFTGLIVHIHNGGGGDLREMHTRQSGTFEEAVAYFDYAKSVFELLRHFGSRTAALVEGTCIGSALEWALWCEWIVAVDGHDTIFRLPETRHGFIMCGGGTYWLPRRIAWSKAINFACTGQPMRAIDARVYGLVDWLGDGYIAMASAERLVLSGYDNPTREGKPLASLLEAEKPIELELGLATYTCAKRNGVFELEPKARDELGLATYTTANLMMSGLTFPADVALRQESEASARLFVSDESRERIAGFLSGIESKKPSASS